MRHDPGDSATSDLCLFLDIDMSVLGWPRERYLKYAEQIRLEYSHVDESTYCTRRASVLRSFLESGAIFCTAEYRHRAEDAARDNVAAEIVELERRSSSLVSQ